MILWTFLWCKSRCTGMTRLLTFTDPFVSASSFLGVDNAAKAIRRCQGLLGDWVLRFVPEEISHPRDILENDSSIGSVDEALKNNSSQRSVDWWAFKGLLNKFLQRPPLI